jgi:aryl-alcohol dehydrogenase-like predicted oxidoreductase
MDWMGWMGDSADWVSRRNFLKLMAATTVATRLGRIAQAMEIKGDIPYRMLGKTGEKVSAIGIGGFHLGVQANEKESIRIVRTAIDAGINFLDNCWDYNDGRSEERMGKALRDGYRNRVFLMTKIDGRDRKSAQRQIDESIQRLQTDHVDLMQVHEVIRMSDPDRVFAAGGAIEALTESKKAGKIRYIGFTGHKSPDIHLHMLKTADAHGFSFDTVQMPLNVMDAHFNSFEKQVLPVLAEKKIGVLGMKPLGDGVIMESHAVEAIDCLHYAMNLPTSTVITGCDTMPALQQALKAAWTFEPLSNQQVGALLKKTAEFAQNGKYELYKTSHRFDSTSSHPQWLG